MRALALLLVAVACATPPAEPPPPVSEWLLAGIEDVRAGRAREGVERIESALRHEELLSLEERVWAHSFAGHGWTLLGAPEPALAQLEAGIALAPDDPWLYYARGVAHRELGDLDAARASFSRSIQLEPRQIKALQFRADVALLANDHARALPDLTRVLELLDEADPGLIGAWGGDPMRLRIWALKQRALCHGMLGDQAAANRDEELVMRLTDELLR